MTTGMELYELLDEIFQQGKAKGRKPGELIEELPADEEKKNKLRELLRFIVEGPNAEEEKQGIQWRY